tara:strand:- start:1445 stop:2218 length:774 start_codon:yes stop_codon:yes gene_type:complete
MFFSKYLISTASSIFLFFTLVSWNCFGQMLELDYSKQKREENSFKVHLIRTGIVGMSSLKHLDFTIEALKLRFDAKKGSHVDFTLYGTQTIWNGSRENVLNTFDFLMNPIGGDINTNLFFSYPLSKKEHQNTKITLSIGKKWIQGQPLPNFQNNSFFDNYGRFGFIYQSTIAEDPMNNSSLYFWTFPSLIIHQGTEESRRQFFNSNLDPFAYGYAVEVGLEYNTQLKVTILGQQILNANPAGEFGQFVTRLIIGYKF